MYRLERIVNFRIYFASLQDKVRIWWSSPVEMPDEGHIDIGHFIEEQIGSCDICGHFCKVKYCRPDVQYEGSRVCLKCYLGDFLDTYVGKKYKSHPTWGTEYITVGTTCHKIHNYHTHMCYYYPNCTHENNQYLSAIGTDHPLAHGSICVDCLKIHGY
jgi:hypothetical protein